MYGTSHHIRIGDRVPVWSTPDGQRRTAELAKEYAKRKQEKTPESLPTVPEAGNEKRKLKKWFPSPTHRSTDKLESFNSDPSTSTYNCTVLNPEYNKVQAESIPDDDQVNVILQIGDDGIALLGDDGTPSAHHSTPLCIFDLVDIVNWGKTDTEFHFAFSEDGVAMKKARLKTDQGAEIVEACTRAATMAMDKPPPPQRGTHTVYRGQGGRRRRRGKSKKKRKGKKSRKSRTRTRKSRKLKN